MKSILPLLGSVVSFILSGVALFGPVLPHTVAWFLVAGAVCILAPCVVALLAMNRRHVRIPVRVRRTKNRG